MLLPPPNLPGYAPRGGRHGGLIGESGTPGTDLQAEPGVPAFPPIGKKGGPAVPTPIDLEKLRSLAVIGRRSGDRVTEYRRPDGVRCKATTDDNGATVTEHATKDDRVDVLVRPATVTWKKPQ